MKKAEVEVGKTYNVKVSGRIQPVRITRASPYGGWDGVNINTKRDIHVRSAARLRSEIGRALQRFIRCRACPNCLVAKEEKIAIVASMQGISVKSEAGMAIREKWLARCKELPCTNPKEV